ncbi:MAG TPA: hypothetical protein VE755_04650, partial [Myxococcales bacterium]|nr:hypothetical protein [Myxococcales bacterium]
VCEGALRVRAGDAPADPALELQGVDVASGDELRQRWFGLADAAANPDPDVLPHREDAWWRQFAGGSDSQAMDRRLRPFARRAANPRCASGRRY